MFISDTWIPLYQLFPQLKDFPKYKDKLILISELLVIVDYNSGFKILIPVPKEVTAETVMEIWDNSIAPYSKYPYEMVSDRDSLFTSIPFKRWMLEHGIKSAMSTPYHPQTDGQTERANRDLNVILRILKAEGKNWIAKVPEVQMALNSRYDSSRKSTPYINLFGIRPNIARPILPHPINYFADPAQRHLNTAQALHESKIKQKEQVDKHRQAAPFYNK